MIPSRAHPSVLHAARAVRRAHLELPHAMTDEPLRARRERIVREHMAAEARGETDATVATFARPRYEIVPTGHVHEGAAAVAAFLADTFRGFPDLRFEVHALHHAEAAVFAEVTFVGTHKGTWQGIPATGRVLRYRMCNAFVFEGDALVCERLYFDSLTILRGLGLARDPLSLPGRVAIALNHPLAIARIAARALRGMFGARR
jgi:steroid delta-isomerase-like uncharacterized protein